MTGVRTGDADPAQTLALLWREPATASRHGPAQRLSVDLVVDAAIALADSEGLAAVSMRRLADRLSVAEQRRGDQRTAAIRRRRPRALPTRRALTVTVARS